ncbi:MAG: sigma-70 family RNA polymerase sigma factor [Lachnospiraceae bacterium]|nr:sigma-70 family RNA polymerase sigma factor [Lachnospiraceae bacterium]
MEFEELYNTYFKDVYRYVLRLSGDAHVAEEVTSDTFFKALKAIHKFRGDCDVRVWLCQIAKNCYYSFLKNIGRAENIDTRELLSLADPEMSVEERLTRKETAKELQELLHRLPEPYKEVFMWRTYAELSFKQIGQMFGKTDNWACVTYHRAGTMLRKGLEESEHEKRM